MLNFRNSSALTALLAAMTLSACDRGQEGSITTPDGEPVYAAIDSTFSSNPNRTFVQLERHGNPLVMEGFVEKREHGFHDAVSPMRDPAHFTDDIQLFLTRFAGRPLAYANAVAGALLGMQGQDPGDKLRVFPNRAAGVTAVTANTPENMSVGWLTQVLAPGVGYGGRKLRGDDTVDKALGVTFGTALGGPVTAPGLVTDNVDNTNPAPLNTFPYFPGPNTDAPPPPPTNLTGAVYVQTNDASRNEVIAYRRSADGTLNLLGAFGTGGKGTGMPRLGSQGSMILSDDNAWLLVANVGSSEISLFAVSNDRLTLTDRVASGGQMPFSLTLRGNLLYVLNAGGSVPGGSDNITAFTLSPQGKLSPIPGSTRPLSSANTAPAQVQFSSDGSTLVVTEKATSKIDTYAVGANGLATGPNVSNSSGQTPFGFAFRPGSNVFVVTEAFNATPGAAAASSYTITGASALQLISGTVRDTQTDVCWTVITNDGRYAYVTNFGSGNISSYSIAANGSITLLQAIAGTTAQAEGPRDQDLSGDGRFLYVIDVGFANPATQAVNGFRVETDGKLTKLGAFPLPQFYPALAGLAAQ